MAAFTDLKTDRIPNGLIIAGIIIGIAGNFWVRMELLQSAASMLLAFALLYPLFKLGTLGAGDIKVLVMTGSFTKLEDFVVIFVLAFVIGAAFSVMKLLNEHNSRERISYFFSYVTEVFCTRQWKIYGEHMMEDYQLYRSNKIHFTVPVLLSAALWIGGII